MSARALWTIEDMAARVIGLGRLIGVGLIPDPLGACPTAAGIFLGRGNLDRSRRGRTCETAHQKPGA